MPSSSKANQSAQNSSSNTVSTLNFEIFKNGRQVETKKEETKNEEIKKSDAVQQQYKAKNRVSKKLLLLVEKKIMELKKQRDQSYYFHAATRRQTIEKKLDALENLKEILQNSRCSYFHLMDKMELEKRAVLFNKEKEFVNNFVQLEDKEFFKDLKQIEARSYDSNTILEIVKKESDDYQKRIISKDKTTPPVLCQKAIEVLTERMDELKNSYRTATRSKKIALLKHLISALERKVPFATVIKEMREKNPDTYLLFEGKTGRVMKLIEYSQLTKKDILNRIDIQLSELKPKRDKIYFFRTKEKNAITEKTIQALTSLRAAVKNLGDEPSLSIFNNNDDGERLLQTLYKYQQPLMEELNSWIKASTIMAADVKALRIR